MLSSDFHCKENNGTTEAAHMIRTFVTIFPDLRRVRSLANNRSLFFRQKTVWIICAAPVVPLFSLQWKSDESTKHYFTQILLAINWRYWQSGKISRMSMKVQFCLVQVRLIEIHQIGYFSNRVLHFFVRKLDCKSWMGCCITELLQSYCTFHLDTIQRFKNLFP